MFYAPVIFSAGGKRDAGLVRVLTLITMIDNFVFTLVSAFISDKLGRKKLFIYGSLGCGISLLMAAVGASNPSTGKEMQTFDWIFAISLYVFVAFFGLSHGPACWLYISEILPSQWMGYGTASSWVFTILISSVSPPLLSAISYGTYLIFAGFMVASTVFSIVCLHETKGKSKQEIMALFAGNTLEIKESLASIFGL
eukprot:TRINITY_DN12820_c0_g1_i10.p1 TRINITY_DN12820_c0_g1~~TRINITY_DN12820_c0_g1_i10.p1  ORF type:complete len:197 (+),score=41.03 TRINITY_DN12820_c0_g1_i10:379-969(+)